MCQTALFANAHGEGRFPRVTGGVKNFVEKILPQTHLPRHCRQRVIKLVDDAVIRRSRNAADASGKRVSVGVHLEMLQEILAVFPPRVAQRRGAAGTEGVGNENFLDRHPGTDVDVSRRKLEIEGALRDRVRERDGRQQKKPEREFHRWTWKAL